MRFTVNYNTAPSLCPCAVCYHSFNIFNLFHNNSLGVNVRLPGHDHYSVGVITLVGCGSKEYELLLALQPNFIQNLLYLKKSTLIHVFHL